MKTFAFARATQSLFVVFTVAATLHACGGADSGGSALIAIDGSSTVFPITEAVAEEFQRENTDARVTVGISGTGGGFAKFCGGETVISNASRPIKPVEIDLCAANGYEFIEVPIAYDGIVVVVNPSNDWVEHVSVDDLRRIWEPAAQRTLTHWQQVRPEWPDREIHLFGPGADSGTFDYFTEVVVGEEDASRGDFTSSEDDNVLVQGIATDELALGFFGYAYFEENRDRLKLVAVDDGNPDNGAGPVSASPDTVRDGTYQPLSRPVFIYVRADGLDRPEVKAFVDYYLTASAGLVREVGYVPLSQPEYELVLERVGARVTGTMFSHGSSESLTSLLTAPAPR